VVQQAATLIFADIREQQYDREFYPTANEVAEDALHFLPPLLHLFLERLVKPDLKRVALGQSLVQAARPTGSIMPLQLALAVELDRLGNSQLPHMSINQSINQSWIYIAHTRKASNALI